MFFLVDVANGLRSVFRRRLWPHCLDGGRARAAAEEAARMAAEAEAEAERRRVALESASRPLGAPSSVPAKNPGAAAARDAVDALGRRQLVSGLSLGGCIELLEASCSAAELADALQTLHVLCANVVSRPEDPRFRNLRLLNASLQSSVARHAGGVEALLAVGFAERESLDDEEGVFYVLEEPSVDDDFEAWSGWYESVKGCRDLLLTTMEARGVRPLPALAKGSGWMEKPPPPPAVPEVLTLHGQRGGGL